ncbi:MAG: cation-translocating P-type ATPase [Candidatus Saccharimonadales bacterium]
MAHKEISIEQRFKELSCSAEGLSDTEAQHRLGEFGPNSFSAKPRFTAGRLLIKQFRSALIYLLMIACSLSLLLKDISDAIVIAVILLINTGIGFFQEFKSEKAVDNLERLVSRQVLVMREGTESLLDETQLVPGDVIVIKEGDTIPADAQLIKTNDLVINEAALSGESVGVDKSLSKGADLIFAGTTVEEGEATALVYSTGSKTRLGSIAGLTTNTNRVTQYEKSLSEFSSFLIKVTFITLLIVFVAKLFIDGNTSHITTLALFTVALAIAVVPEAMPVIATVTLSSGALKLAKKHVIAKTLTAVEDLGNINVLCSDKTGTLTEDKQNVKQLIAKDKQLFMRLAASSLGSSDAKHHHPLNSFDQALVEFIPSAITHHATSSTQRIEELPFDPQARRRRVVFKEDGKTYLVEIGSVETLLDLTHETKTADYLEILKANGKLGLRHLGIAYKQVIYDPKKEFEIKQHEKDLKFAGFVALEDRLRPSAKSAIDTARKLGLSIKILSGDSREVTAYVAREVGLIDEHEVVYVGEEIDTMNDTKLSEVLENNSAFARLTPEQKYRIINILKAKGNVVGYQGDGINDAPSLKLADVAIAVNNATDVARDSADILLLRSDLDVIVNGIKYGRGIFANINKYIRYTMIGNFGNFFALSALFLLSASLPLLTIQLLLTNLLGDVPLIVIATDNVDAKSLHRPSRYDMHSLIFISIVLGSFTAIFEIFFYALVRSQNINFARTDLYLYLTVIGFVVIMAVRNRDHFFKAVKMSAALKWAFGIIALLSVALIYFPPTRTVFSFKALPLRSLGLIALMTGAYLVILDIIKVWFYRSPLAGK